MPPIKRRHFIQSAGATLAAIGLSQFDFLQQATQFDRVNAQVAPRKLALLVGINDYPTKPLNGCLQDVKSMELLLEHRYGFDPKDILTLTDAQATRQGILSAFERHLIAQAKPGDVVVFHFSGHGFMVLDPDPNPNSFYNKQGVNGTIIPFDVAEGEDNNLRSIMGHTLFLLVSALKTEKVTFVLDSCHSGGGLRGNTQVRSLNLRDGQSANPSPNNRIPAAPKEELAYQQTLLTQLQLSEAKFKQQRKLGIAKGVGIGAASLEQESLDVQFSGFSAGAFTYLLTRYLWQLPTTQPLDTMFTNLQLGTQVLSHGSQVPDREVKPGSRNGQQPIFFTTAPQLAAEAVIHEAPQPGQPIKFWLGGVSPGTLESYQPGAVFNLIDAQGQVVGEIEQTATRDGLEALGKLRSGSKVQPAKGMLLREQIRNLSPNTRLKVGLDPSLGRDLADVQQALHRVSWLDVTPIGQKQTVDYLIGRMTPANTQRLQATSKALPPINAISLFTADLTPVPDAFSVNEPLKTALARLRPRLKFLLAGQVLRSMLGDSSPLKVSAEILPVDGENKPLGAGRTLNSRGLPAAAIQTQAMNTQSIKLGTNLGVRIRNNEAQNLYVATLYISDTGEMGVLFPFGYEAPESASLVPPTKQGEAFIIPKPFAIYGTPGFLELLILVSREPLRDALRALQNIARGRNISRGQAIGLEADEADTVVSSLLGDIDRSSRGPYAEVAPESRAIDAGKLAALSAVFQVVQ